jgi:hypothetical protein
MRRSYAPRDHIAAVIAGGHYHRDVRDQGRDEQQRRYDEPGSGRRRSPPGQPERAAQHMRHGLQQQEWRMQQVAGK